MKAGEFCIVWLWLWVCGRGVIAFCVCLSVLSCAVVSLSVCLSVCACALHSEGRKKRREWFCTSLLAWPDAIAEAILPCVLPVSACQCGCILKNLDVDDCLAMCTPSQLHQLQLRHTFCVELQREIWGEIWMAPTLKPIWTSRTAAEGGGGVSCRYAHRSSAMLSLLCAEEIDSGVFLTTERERERTDQSHVCL